MNKSGVNFQSGITIKKTIEKLTASFTESSTPRLDAQVLLSHVLSKPRVWLFTHMDQILTSDEKFAIYKSSAKIKDGIPLPYIIGHWEFFGLDFSITPDVLIPRPETELIVEKALQWLTEHPKQVRILDIGTGSGNIAIAIALNNPRVHITALDISLAALAVARKNAFKHHIDQRITFFQADLFDPISSTLDGIQPPFDIITANLPYIPTGMLEGLTVFKREPSIALDGGPDGFAIIRRFLQNAGDFISPGGCILMEIESNQGESGLKLALGYFPRAEITLHQDLSGNDRLLKIKP